MRTNTNKDKGIDAIISDNFVLCSFLFTGSRAPKVITYSFISKAQKLYVLVLHFGKKAIMK